MLTEAQKIERHGGIGGSDAPAALGLSPWKTPLELWTEKTAPEPPPDTPSEYMTWGSLLEDTVAIEAAVRLNPDLDADHVRRWPGSVIRRSNIMRRYSQAPFMTANIDRVIVHSDAILEVKTTGWRTDDWGEPGTDQVPEQYLAQCLHYLVVTGREQCHLAVLFMGPRELGLYTINRDPEAAEALVEAEREFWEGHVLTGLPPEPRSVADARARWRGDPAVSIEAGVEALAALQDLRLAKRVLKEAEEVEAEAMLRLMKCLGEGTEMIDSEGRALATWKRQSATRIDSAKLRELHPEIAKECSKVKSTRVLRLKKPKEEKT